MMADKEKMAIERLKTASEMSFARYGLPLNIQFSGGKDSEVLLHLAEISGIPFVVSHALTTADAPETVKFIKQEFHRLEDKGIECNISLPTYKGKITSMWQLIPMKLFPPTRLMRYCCEVLKESSTDNCFIATGVRWDESQKRQKRGIFETITKDVTKRTILNNDNDDKRLLFENCQMRGELVVNPIIDWTTEEVWDYTHTEKLPCNPLYCVFKRVGCIGCPMASKGRYKEFERYPKYKDLYIRSFDRVLERRRMLGKSNNSGWQTGRDVFHWWMEDGILPGQIEFDDLMEDK